MTIDWLTVTAQLINFLILVWLLKRYLYRPILDGIDAREQEIATRMGEAASIREQASKAQQNYEQRVKALQKSESETLAIARNAAESERVTLLAELQQRINNESRAARVQQQQQAREFVTQLNNQAGTLVLDITRKALSDLSDEALEERLVSHALFKLHERLEDKKIAEAATSLSTHVCTRTALSKATIERIEQSLSAHWPTLSLSFASDDTQSPGAVVQVGSVQVDWTIDTYVDELASALNDKLLDASVEDADTHNSATSHVVPAALHEIESGSGMKP